ncbi:LysR family transcriptional regulator [Paenibacillus sp. J31TS4]|uniref:LysR family transcriptional regulator n=1 Tax=Paenibacillus sp. J31TS4 TaxID=2807195 RepID=UPI001B17137A|nr:LysR family transcriptional regulator [Paenibacillus sp. J31TS4]GIP39348.1 LysR family transcriptional regulator [Paenibacillus sp. J31TS4]
MEQQLKVFLTVAELKHFSLAAEKLHMTQPGVSQHVRQLERMLDATLLERSNRKVTLTKAGEIVYAHAKEIVRLQERMRHLVEDLSGTPSGPLSIGASYTFGEYVLPHLAAPFVRLYPHIEPAIQIGNTTQIAALVAGRQLDVGIVEGQVNQEGLTAEPLARDELLVILASGHPLAGEERLTARQLEEQMWIVREEGSGTRAMADRLFEELGIAPRRMAFGSTQLIKESVEAGLGVSLLSAWTIQKELALGTVKALPVEGWAGERPFWLIRRASAYSTMAMELFGSYVKAEAPRLRSNDFHPLADGGWGRD